MARVPESRRESSDVMSFVIHAASQDSVRGCMTPHSQSHWTMVSIETANAGGRPQPCGNRRTTNTNSLMDVCWRVAHPVFGELRQGRTAMGLNAVTNTPAEPLGVGHARLLDQANRADRGVDVAESAEPGRVIHSTVRFRVVLPLWVDSPHEGVASSSIAPARLREREQCTRSTCQRASRFAAHNSANAGRQSP